MIPHNRPTLGAEEAAAATRVLASGWVAQGTEVEAFEAELAIALALPAGSVVAVASGSAALFVALEVLGARGRRVAVPVYSCAALLQATRLAGADPVFVDCAEGSPLLDFDAVDRAAPDIVLAPALFGLPLRPRPAVDRRNVLDLAQALGARLDGRSLAAGAEVGICSFGATKPITAGGQGGAVFFADPALAAAARDFRVFDGPIDGRPHFNVQLTDLQAAVGRVQLARLSDFAARRRALWEIYREVGLPLLDTEDPGADPLRYRAVMHTRTPAALIEALAAAGVRAIVPIATDELLDDPARHPVAADLARTTVSLPIYPTLHPTEARRIAAIASRFP